MCACMHICTWVKEKSSMSKNRWEEIQSALDFWEGNGDLIHEKEKEDEWYRVQSCLSYGMRIWTIVL